MNTVHSYFEFLTKAQYAENVLLLICKPDHELSQLASRQLEIAYRSNQNIPIFRADNNRVHEICRIYELEVFPALLVFKDGRFIKSITGCRDAGFYASIYEDSVSDPIMKRKNSIEVTDSII